MKDECRSLLAAPSVKVLTVNMFLSVFFLPGVWAECKTSNLNITAPKKLEALSGSCLIIPCSFTTTPGNGQKFDSTREIFGVWIKNFFSFRHRPQNVIFNSSKQENIYPMKIIGNLKQKNCTTLFSNLTSNYTETYYFRIENGKFKAGDFCNYTEIKIQDSPQSPSIDIPAGLKEGASVSITCSAPTPCPHSPPELTWNLQPNSQRQMEKNTDGSFTTKIQKNITLSDTHDGLIIICSARYPVNEGPPKTAETNKTLSVSYAPKNTSASISPSGLVSAGSRVTMTCYSRANPAVRNFSWFRSSKDGDVKIAEGESYSLNATEGGGAYYCVATNNLGNQTSPKIHLIVGDSLQLTIQTFGRLAVILILTCLIFCIWCFRKIQRQQQQKPPATELDVQNPAIENEDEL